MWLTDWQTTTGIWCEAKLPGLLCSKNEAFDCQLCDLSGSPVSQPRCVQTVVSVSVCWLLCVAGTGCLICLWSWVSVVSKQSGSLRTRLSQCSSSRKMLMSRLDASCWRVSCCRSRPTTLKAWVSHLSMFSPVISMFSSNIIFSSQRTSPTTAVLSPMLVSDDWVPQRAKHALWCGHTTPSAIEHFQLLDPDYRTVFHRTWKWWTYRMYNRFQQSFCLDKVAKAQCELF